LGPAIDEHFPAAEFPPSRLRIIAEPGRYFVASCATLATRVIAKRSVPSGTADGEKSVMYYINDGVYGAFNCVLYDHQVVHAKVLQAETVGEPLQTTVWGPSCDSMDLVKKNFAMTEVDEGDWFYWQNMGAYTFCAQSTFNGFANSTPFYTYSKVGNGPELVGEAEQPPFLLNLTPTAEADYVWKCRPEY
jgi:ornithine decarboxylase